MSRNDAPPTMPATPTSSAWATTVTAPYAAEPGGREEQPAERSGADPGPGSAPALNPPTWSGRKTAIAAALAIGISAAGAVGAAAAVPTGTAQTDQGGPFQQGGFGRGGQLRGQFQGGQFPGGQQSNSQNPNGAAP